MKTFLTVKNMLILALVLILVLLAAFSYSRVSSVNKQIIEAVEKAQQEAEKKYQDQLQSKDSEIKVIDNKLKDLQTRLFLSETKYKIAIQKIADLEREKINVKPPQNSSERRDRFNAAGFPMLPIKQ